MLNMYTKSIVTNSSGAATVLLGSSIRGKIIAIKYVPGTIATGATLTFTAATTGQPVLTKANAGTSTAWYYPVSPAHAVTDGSPSTLTERDIWLFMEALQLVVASGGDGGAGSVTLLVDEPVERASGL